ncbi:MAG: site-specific integrase, partial [Ktedonobacterales bacterium]
MANDLVVARGMLTCNQLVQAWLAAKTARSAETRRAYARGLEAFRRFLAPLDLDAADPRHVRLTLPVTADVEAQTDA